MRENCIFRKKSGAPIRTVRRGDYSLLFGCFMMILFLNENAPRKISSASEGQGKRSSVSSSLAALFFYQFIHVFVQQQHQRYNNFLPKTRKGGRRSRPPPQWWLCFGYYFIPPQQVLRPPEQLPSGSPLWCRPAQVQTATCRPSASPRRTSASCSRPPAASQ